MEKKKPENGIMGLDKDGLYLIIKEGKIQNKIIFIIWHRLPKMKALILEF